LPRVSPVRAMGSSSRLPELLEALLQALESEAEAGEGGHASSGLGSPNE
jgi:hypothetical protein